MVLMGFIVQDDLTFPRFGVTIAGCYVTIRATYASYKQGQQHTGLAPAGMIPVLLAAGDVALPYQLITKYYVYSDQAGSEQMSPMDEGICSISTATPQDNPIATLYAAIKARYFSDKITIDS